MQAMHSSGYKAAPQRSGRAPYPHRGLVHAGPERCWALVKALNVAAECGDMAAFAALLGAAGRTAAAASRTRAQRRAACDAWLGEGVDALIQARRRAGAARATRLAREVQKLATAGAPCALALDAAVIDNDAVLVAALRCARLNGRLHPRGVAAALLAICEHSREHVAATACAPVHDVGCGRALCSEDGCAAGGAEHACGRGTVRRPGQPRAGRAHGMVERRMCGPGISSSGPFCAPV